jgi:hypothetical protein
MDCRDFGRCRYCGMCLLCDLCGDFASFAVKSLNRKGLGKVGEENRIDQARILVP